MDAGEALHQLLGVRQLGTRRAAGGQSNALPRQFDGPLVNVQDQRVI